VYGSLHMPQNLQSVVDTGYTVIAGCRIRCISHGSNNSCGTFVVDSDASSQATGCCVTLAARKLDSEGVARNVFAVRVLSLD
jgi:hypothetical protein